MPQGMPGSVVLTPDGTKLACDVVVTAFPTPAERHGPHLEKTAAAKARQYHTVPWGKCHKEATFVPLVHNAQQLWLHPAALRLLHRLVLAIAKRTAPEAPQAWGTHFFQTGGQCAVPLLQAACLSAWQMHAACGCLMYRGGRVGLVARIYSRLELTGGCVCVCVCALLVWIFLSGCCYLVPLCMFCSSLVFHPLQEGRSKTDTAQTQKEQNERADKNTK